MLNLTPPVAIAAALPWLATFLSALLADDNFKPGTNAIIAAAALLTTAILCAVLAGNFTGNVSASLLAIIGYTMILMRGDLAILYDYMVEQPSPVARLLTPPTIIEQPKPANSNPIRMPVIPPQSPKP